MWVLDNLEYIVAGIGILSIPIFLRLKHVKRGNNDITSYLIKHNKQREALLKKSKGGLLS